MILLLSGLPLCLGRGHDAPPASRLNTQMSGFPICWGPFLRPSDPACRYPCIAAVVSLWGAFPALILHTGNLLESDCQPFSQLAQASVDVAVSVMLKIPAHSRPTLFGTLSCQVIILLYHAILLAMCRAISQYIVLQHRTKKEVPYIGSRSEKLLVRWFRLVWVHPYQRTQTNPNH